MFLIHVGATPCELSPKDYRTLALRSEGYVFNTNDDANSRKLSFYPQVTPALI
jgi:hypothetical protein